MMPFNPRFYTYVHHPRKKKASLTVPLYAHRNGGASESMGIGAKYDPSKDLLSFMHPQVFAGPGTNLK